MGTRVTSRRSLLTGMCALGASIIGMQPLAACSRLPIRPPHPPPPARLGFLGPADPRTDHASFWQALRSRDDQGGQTYAIDYERPSGVNGYADQAAQLVERRPEVILTQGDAATAAALDATSTIPIVFSLVDDPVQKGFVTSQARPGGNATGLSNVTDDLVQKRVELARELLPFAERLAVVWSPAIPGQEQHVSQADQAATSLGFHVQEIRVSDRHQIPGALPTLNAGYAHALLVMPAWFFFEERAQFLDAVSRNRLPAVYSYVGWVRAGGLMSFDGSLGERADILARYVASILHGVKPAALPVQQQSKFDLAINRRSALSQGLTVPQSLMVQATEVIEDTNDF
jgi:putative ABC transport system substrate-binding protein